MTVEELFNKYSHKDNGGEYMYLSQFEKAIDELTSGLLVAKVSQVEPEVKPACGYCKDCKFWKQENLECKNDIIWLNKDKNVFFNISDLKTNKFFGCMRFESKSV